MIEACGRSLSHSIGLTQHEGFTGLEEEPQLVQCSYLLTDVNNGYLGLVVGQECFVQRLGPLSLLHKFKIEDCNEDVPCMMFLPNSTASSPGLVSCTSRGAIQFWSNIHAATLSLSPNPYLKAKIDLDDTDSVKFLVACGAFGFIIGTQQKLYFVSHSQGQLHYLTLSRHHTWSLLTFIRRYTIPDCIIDLVAACFVTCDQAHALIYALTPSSILAWQVRELSAQDPSFIQEWFLLPLRPEIEARLQTFDFEFLEMIATSQGDLVLIVQSLPARETAVILLPAPQPKVKLSNYSIIRLDTFETRVVAAFTVPYLGLDQDAVVALQFPTCLVLVTLGLSRHQVSIPFASKHQLLEVHDVAGTCSSLLAGLDASLLNFQIHPPCALGVYLTNDNPLYNVYRSLKDGFNQALAKMGNNKGAPLTLPEGCVKADSRVLLSGVVTELVDEIMQMRSSERMALDSILEGRGTLLRNLTFLLSEKGLVPSISVDARHHIAAASQKVAGATALYLHYLHRLRERDKSPASQVLSSALQALYLRTDTVDFVATFFSHDLQQLPDLLALVAQRTGLPNSLSPAFFGSYGALMFEANTILLKVMGACKGHTRFSYVLQLDAAPTFKPWIQAMVQVLAASFLGTLRLLTICPTPVLLPSNTKLDIDWARTVDLHEVTDHPRLLARALRIHLGGLGEHLLWLVHQPFTQANQHRELIDKIFATFVQHQLGCEALELAERYRDFASLASLITTLYSDLATHRAKADKYASQYGDAFIYALLAHYAHANRFSRILASGDVWPDQVSQFLDDPKYYSVGWLNDLHRQRFAAASKKLAACSTHQGRISTHKAFVSIAKLATLAQGDAESKQVNSLENQLELSRIHEDLQQATAELLKDSGCQSHASDLNFLIPSHLIEASPFQTKQFVASVQQLLGGQLLDFESLIDVLTFKDDWDFEVHGAFEEAIEACRCVEQGNGEVHKYALRTIWRRTALYTLLLHILNRDLTWLILDPTQCLFDSSSSYLSARFPHLSQAQVSALLGDSLIENLVP
ncbi:hypothetical protein L0F63_005566 [Massospora cicadina]|nr:hypothetical protein L0F63_005566 [Massospora cicadina]